MDGSQCCTGIDLDATVDSCCTNTGVQRYLTHGSILPTHIQASYTSSTVPISALLLLAHPAETTAIYRSESYNMSISAIDKVLKWSRAGERIELPAMMTSTQWYLRLCIS